MREKIPTTFEDDSIQNYISPWWIEDDKMEYQVGRLVWAYVPYVSVIPYMLEVTGRAEATDLTTGNFEIKELRVDSGLKKDHLPVAGLPLRDNEVYWINKTKKRPAIILFSEGYEPEKNLTQGMPGWQKHPAIVVAPYYGADKDGGRGGFPEEFMERVKHCEYPQFMLDKLPFSGSESSILYMNHMHALGKHYNSIELTKFRLSDDALVVLEEWVTWFHTDELDTDKGLLASFKSEVGTLFI